MRSSVPGCSVIAASTRPPAAAASAGLVRSADAKPHAASKPSTTSGLTEAASSDMRSPVRRSWEPREGKQRSWLPRLLLGRSFSESARYVNERPPKRLEMPERIARSALRAYAGLAPGFLPCEWIAMGFPLTSTLVEVLWSGGYGGGRLLMGTGGGPPAHGGDARRA